MKNFIVVIVFGIILISCKKNNDNPIPELTVDALSKYCSTATTPCFKPLPHEGEKVTITGFIHALNTFENDSRFQIFHSSSITSTRMDINVINDNKNIFSLLRNTANPNDVNEFQKFKITGKIESWDAPINNNCSKGVKLIIESVSNVIPSE